MFHILACALQVITKIAGESNTALQYVTNSGLLQDLLTDLGTDDVLIQLNAAEMLTNLAMCHHGLMYLTQQGIVGKMESMMVEAEADPLQDFLLPGKREVILKALGDQIEDFVYVSVFDSLYLLIRF